MEKISNYYDGLKNKIFTEYKMREKIGNIVSKYNEAGYASFGALIGGIVGVTFPIVGVPLGATCGVLGTSYRDNITSSYSTTRDYIVFQKEKLVSKLF